MIEYILLAGAAVVIGGAVGNMLYRPPANVCTPGARGCQLTGAYQDRQALGEGAVGGYYEQAQVKQESAGHVGYWASQPMPHVQTETRENEWWNDTTTPREATNSVGSGAKWMAENGVSIHQDQPVEVAQHVHVRLSR